MEIPNKGKKKDVPTAIETSQKSQNDQLSDIKNNSTKSTKSQEIKKRNWAFIVYPESVTKDWKEVLQKSGLQCAISPLHDNDINPTGELKKPHWHVIGVYGNPTTYKNVKALTERLNAPAPQGLEQVKGYYRYLTHKDNPEKAQYEDKDIELINGFNILDMVEISRSEALAIKKELHLIIRENQITEYMDLLDYAMFNLTDGHYDIVVSNTILFNTAIKSLRHKRMRVAQGERMIDFATGEVLQREQ